MEKVFNFKDYLEERKRVKELDLFYEKVKEIHMRKYRTDIDE